MELEIKKLTTLKWLINHIKPDRPVFQSFVNLTFVDEFFNTSNFTFATITHEEYKANYAHRKLVFDENEELVYYLDNTSNPDYWHYYQKRTTNDLGEPVVEYRRLDTIVSAWHELIEEVESSLVKINLLDKDISLANGLHFDTTTNRMCIHDLETVDVEPFFRITDEVLENYEDGQEFEMEFVNDRGNTKDYWENMIFGFLPFGGDIVSWLEDRDRFVKIHLNQKTGYVSRYPIIKTGGIFNPYELRYDYDDRKKGVAKSVSFGGIKDVLFDFRDNGQGNAALRFQFKTVYAFLEFTNRVFFRNKSNLNLEEGRSEIQEFYSQYIDIVREEYDKRLLTLNEKFKLLYFLPPPVIKHLSRDSLWSFLINVLQDWVTNIGQDKEDIVFKQLSILSEMHHPDEFLDNLMELKVDKDPLLKILTKRLDGYNFAQFVELVREVWKGSSYASFSSDNDLIRDDGKSPLLLPYKSDKTIGFHHDNASIDWTNKNKEIEVQVFDYDQLESDSYAIEFALQTVVPSVDAVLSPLLSSEDGDKYIYNPFTPLVILSEENPEFFFKDQNQMGGNFQIMPAFVLLANDERAFWENVMTASEYAFDIITTFSGIGNIAKAGRLFRVFNAGKSALLKTGKVTRVFAGVKRVAGAVEVTSGVGNGLLKLTGAIDTPYGRAASQILMFLELGAMGGELTIALQRAISKAAQKAVYNAPDIGKGLNNADNLSKQIDEAVKGTKLSQEVAEAIAFIKRVAGQLEDAYQILIEKLLQAGAIARQLDFELYVFSQNLQADLADLGVQFFKVIDRKLFKNTLDQIAPDFALANAGKIENFATWKGEELFTGTKKQFDEFSDRLKDAWKKGGRRGLINSLDEALSEKEFIKLTEHFLKVRREFKRLYKNNPDLLEEDFRKAFEIKHLDVAENKKFYEDMINKYPELKGKINNEGKFEQDNIAWFETSLIKNGIISKIEEIAHSGKKFVSDDFIPNFDNSTASRLFQKGVVDFGGGPRRKDSELKYIFHFLKNHFHKADEFVIQTKNIYFTCDSCQRELLMLKSFVESQGKKMTFIVIADEGIQGGQDLFENVIKQ